MEFEAERLAAGTAQRDGPSQPHPAHRRPVSPDRGPAELQAAIVRWESAGYLELMKRQGRENRAKIKEIMAAV